MWNRGCRPISLRRSLLLVCAGVVLVSGPVAARAADQTELLALESAAAEKIELFLALLKRRAQRVLEAHQAPPPPTVTYATSISQGYESNVNLAGDKRGDFFTQETLNVTYTPQIRPWLSGEFEYGLLNTHYADLRDANLWLNNLAGTFQFTPHERVRVDVGYEYGIVDFPEDTGNSFFDKRTSLFLLLAQTAWLTHRTGWTYQLRDFDTRRALGADGVATAVVREDQRHVLSHELRFRFPKTRVRVGGEFYRNFSNDLFRDFYDWEDYRIRGVVSRVFSPSWVGVMVSSRERRNYQKRRVPVINIGERDDLTTVAGSLIYLIDDNSQVTYSVTYRHQDSNDPRLDFIDWINQVRVSMDF